MIDIKYATAFTEVLEILKYIPIQDYNKIPKCKIEVFEENCNKEYKFIYNPSKTLEEQNVSEGGQAIIGLLFRDYWATEEQKNKIIKKQNYDRQQFEILKSQQYNPDDIFKKVNKDNNINMETPETKINTALIQYKKSFFTRFKNFIFKILRINK